MVLQTSSQVCKLDSRYWSSYSPILFRMKFVFARIHEDAIAIYGTLVGNRFVWLTAVVESYRISPNVLFSFANLLPVVLPVHSVPVTVIVDAVFEACPDSGAAIHCCCIDEYKCC